MDISSRKKKILAAVIEEYIRTAEPVGSKAIAASADLGCSSATIRNELAELVAMGYLEQPHTSAGRVPTPLGYRMYVNELMEVLDTLTPREKKVLELRFGIVDGRTRTLEEVGKEFNVTRERIRQIEAKALRKLRHPSRSKKLKDFLN